MKVGYQTIVWGPWISPIERALDIIAAAGYQGVEFAQRPEMLGSIDTLLQMLKERDLELLGLAGGMLWERMEYCGSFRPLYLYVEDWDEIDGAEAVARGFTLALHPQVYKRIHRLGDARRLLELHPELKWMPDTAHPTIAGDDPVESLRMAPNRIISVHLKDWTPVYGRSSHRYSRGFTELGEGEVPLDSFVRELQRMNYDGWLIAEQDCTRTDPATSALKCAQWLRERGLLQRSTAVNQKPICHANCGKYNKLSTSSPVGQQSIFTDLSQTRTERVGDCYQSIADAFAAFIPCHLVTVWACSPADDVLSLLAVSPSALSFQEHVQTSGSLTGIAMERQCATRFNLREEMPGARYHRADARFGAQDLRQRFPLHEMVTIPLLNPYNANHVRALVNLFPSSEEFTASADDLFRLGIEAARAADAALDDLCGYAAGSANALAGRCKQVKDFAEGVLHLIQDVIDCEGCSLFVVDETDARLRVAATTGLSWTVPVGEQYYRKADSGAGLTGRVWARNEAILGVDATKQPNWVGKSSESVITSDLDSCLLAPLVTAGGRVLGVVRGRNKRATKQGGRDMFSDNDLAIIDAITQAVLPHLQILLSEERRAKSVMRLMHELRSFLAAIRGAAEWMERDIRARGQMPQAAFRRDYLGDVWQWTELMRGLLINAEFYGLKAEAVRPDTAPTFLWRDIVAPSVRQVSMLLRERRFSMDHIQYDHFEQIPQLWIDRHHFHQVFFNLLSNCIKYAFRDPNAFQVVIESQVCGTEFTICCRDWGMGVLAGYEKAIFEEGIRGAGAYEQNVGGQGLGLWVVRQIVEAHRGTVCLTHNKLPTEITIRLPEFLTKQWVAQSTI